MFCRFKQFGGLTSSGEELIQSVDGHELNASRLVDLLLANLTDDFLHDPFGPAVAVVVRILEQLAAFSQQRIVHAPGVNADARQFHFAQSRESLPHFIPEPRHVPVKRSAIVRRVHSGSDGLLRS